MIVGITGSIGSGKTTVAQMMGHRLNSPIFDADASAHCTLRQGEPAYLQVVEKFGSGILDECGEIDRSVLGRIVFADAHKLKELNECVHPYVHAVAAEFLHDCARQGQSAILDVSLLFESGFNNLADVTIVVAVDEATRYERVARRNGLTPEQVRKRLAAQMPQEEKIRRADYALSNNGSLQDLEASVGQLAQAIAQ